jgi:hypothetical protein
MQGSGSSACSTLASFALFLALGLVAVMAKALLIGAVISTALFQRHDVIALGG